MFGLAVSIDSFSVGLGFKTIYDNPLYVHLFFLYLVHFLQAWDYFLEKESMIK